MDGTEVKVLKWLLDLVVVVMVLGVVVVGVEWVERLKCFEIVHIYCLFVVAVVSLAHSLSLSPSVCGHIFIAIRIESEFESVSDSESEPMVHP